MLLGPHPRTHHSYSLYSPSPLYALLFWQWTKNSKIKRMSCCQNCKARTWLASPASIKMETQNPSWFKIQQRRVEGGDAWAGAQKRLAGFKLHNVAVLLSGLWYPSAARRPLVSVTKAAPAQRPPAWRGEAADLSGTGWVVSWERWRSAQAKYMVLSVSWWIWTALASACGSLPLLCPETWLPSALHQGGRGASKEK